MGIILVAMVLFGLPMRGSWLLLLLALSLFLVGALGLGLLISSVADTQQVAFQLALLASFLPTLMLSGFIFPIASMPAFLRAVTYARAGALLPDRAARHRAEGRRDQRVLGRAGRAGGLRGRGADAGVGPAAAAVG